MNKIKAEVKMNKAKKFFAIIMSVCMLTWAFVGCPNVDTGTDDDNTTGSSGTQQPNPGPGPGPGPSGKIASLQAQIDSTPVGGTVNLNLAADDTTEKITITKPITVNAAKVGKGLKVEVAHNISSNVGLKGFQSGSSLKIASSTLATVGRGAVENKDADTFKKYGDGALPLFLDDCKFDKFESESDVAVYFEGEKSVIDELEIKKGEKKYDIYGEEIQNPEDVKFTFIDMGEKPEDMSYIKEMFVDKDVCDVNLIGGKFDEVKFDPAAEMNFKFDGEFDQFADAKFIYGEKTEDFSNKTFDKEFWDDTTFWGDKFDVKDITLAEKDLEAEKLDTEDTNPNLTGVYKYNMSRAQFDYLDGGVSIIFLTDDQMNALKNPQTNIDHTILWNAISPETPAYTMSLMGTFAADSTSNGVHTIHGTESHYMVNGLRHNQWTYQQVYLKYYQNYSKDAVVVDIGEDEVTYYVNAAAVRKGDLLIGAYPHYEVVGGAIYTNGGIAGAGSKLSKIELTGYKPYFVIDTNKLELLKCAAYAEFNGKMWEPKQDQYDQYNEIRDAMNNWLDNTMDGFSAAPGMYFPMDPESGFFEFGQPEYKIFSMDNADEYPTNLEADDPVRVPDDVMGRHMVTVHYWENNAWSRTERFVIGEIDPWLDDWYYFTTQDCDDASYFSYRESWDDYGNHSFYHNNESEPFHPEFDGENFWAKPKEKINQFVVGLESNPDGDPQSVSLQGDDMPINFNYSESGKASMEPQETSKREFILTCSGQSIESSSSTRYYKTFDWSKSINEGRFSDPINAKEGKLDLDTLKEGDTVYAVTPYVILNEVKNGEVVGSATMGTCTTWSGESLYDTAAFDSLNWYKDATLTTKWTKAELQGKVEVEVFIEKVVIVYDNSDDKTGTKVAYDTFVTNVENGQIYYSNPDSRANKIINPPAQDPTDPNPAPIPMGKLLETFGNPVKAGQAVKAYKYLSAIGKDDMGLRIYDTDGSELWPSDGSLFGTVTGALSLMTKGKGYDLFSDENCTQQLVTREDFEALDYLATIYAKYKGKKFTEIEISDTPTEPRIITEDVLLASIGMVEGGMVFMYYTDAAKTDPITADDIDDLTNGQTIYSEWSEPKINVVIGANTQQMTKTAIWNVTYTINPGITVPFGGKALLDQSTELTAQYLLYSDNAKTQPLGTSDIDNLSANSTVYAEKPNVIFVGYTNITLPDTAIEKYLAAGAHFYPDASMTEGTELNSTTINAAFADGKIYLQENIIDVQFGYIYNVFTVYIDDGSGSGFGSAQVMFQEAIYDYIYGDIGDYYDSYSDEACQTRVDVFDCENGATVYLKKREQQP